tara:strand:+ start:88 stop:441 length:354 start_codon:yes stop_codon:yes gene_type:complete
MYEHDYTISEYYWKDDISEIVAKCIKSYSISTVDKAQVVVLQELIHAMHGHIASLMMDVTGMKEVANTDWEEEVGNLYDFLCEHKPHQYYKDGQLLDEYHEWNKKQKTMNAGDNHAK